jgi:hypothetical protein
MICVVYIRIKRIILYIKELAAELRYEPRPKKGPKKGARAVALTLVRAIFSALICTLFRPRRGEGVHGGRAAFGRHLVLA